MKKIVQFFKDCIAELKRVSWPKFPEAVSSVKVVFVSTIIAAAILGLLDWAFTTGLRQIF